MSHTYAQNVIHVVFSTKERRKTIPVEFQPKMWAYSAGICKKQGIFVHAIGGMEDHVHFLIQVPPTMALAKAVLAIKSNSSRCKRGRPQARVAAGLCGIQCERIYCSSRRSIHRKSGSASQRNEL